VICTHCLENGNSKHIPKEVQKYLLESKINTVLSGHQPHGDCPNVICTGGVKVIVADTSYSQMGSKSAWGADNRGVHCVSEVLVKLDGSCEVHGQLADEREREREREREAEHLQADSVCVSGNPHTLAADMLN